MEASKCQNCSKDIKNYKFRYCFLCSKERKKIYIAEHPNKCKKCEIPVKCGFSLCYSCNKKKPVVEVMNDYNDYF
jgi:hypothetical protein